MLFTIWRRAVMFLLFPFFVVLPVWEPNMQAKHLLLCLAGATLDRKSNRSYFDYIWTNKKKHLPLSSDWKNQQFGKIAQLVQSPLVSNIHPFYIHCLVWFPIPLDLHLKLLSTLPSAITSHLFEIYSIYDVFTNCCYLYIKVGHLKILLEQTILPI